MSRILVPLLFLLVFLGLVVYPGLALLVRWDPADLSRIFRDSYFWASARLTMMAAFWAAGLGLTLAVGFGYLRLFCRRSLLYRWVDLLIDLPAAVPHTVLGLALLLAFGRRAFGFLGPTGLAFTFTGVVLAMFLTSYPMAVRAVLAGVAGVDREMIAVARTLGDTPFKAYARVVLPTLGEAVLSGFVLAFARAVSEFAAVAMFGGNMPGETQVLSAYVFTKLEEGELGKAVAVGVFCLGLALGLVLLLKGRRKRKAAEGGWADAAGAGDNEDF